jgi:glycosyltransferase involved in cell wall biosynthesis
MYLLIDVQCLQTPDSRVRGIGRYARNLLAGIAAARPGWRIELVQSTALEPADPPLLDHLPGHLFTPPYRFVFDNNEANERYYADWLAAQAPDAILVLSWFERVAIVPQFCGPRPRLVGVLYDLIPLLFPRHYLSDCPTFTYYARRFRQALQADGLLTISQATADDLASLVGPPLPDLVPIGGAADPTFARHSEEALSRHRTELTQRLDLHHDFILYVGGFDERKNLAGAMRAFAALPDRIRHDLDLVIACKLLPTERRFLEDMASTLGIDGSVKLSGYVSDDELRALYQLCRLFFFPSLYEGLGLPVLEALQCGAPVVAANRASVPEFTGSVCWLADPTSTEDLARAIQAALAEPRDARLQARLDHVGHFRWDKVADLACGALTPAAPCLTPPRRRRVAWVSPLPPNASGIADYSADLLEHLGATFDIELVTDPQPILVSYPLGKRHQVLTSKELPARHRACPFDVFVYHLGNSPFHCYMLELLWQFRGLVVLHDYSVGGLVLTAMQRGLWPATLEQELHAEGKDDVAAWVREHGLNWDYVVDRAPLNRRLLQAADAVLAHSAWVCQKVRRAADVPVARVPMPVPVPPELSSQPERRRLGLPADKFIIATLGQVGVCKRVESLLQAVAQLPSGMRDQSLLAVVGALADYQRDQLLSLAEQLGIESLVRIVGRVPFDDLLAYAAAVDVCVQLRYPTHGETSAALYRALAMGAPCIISDHGPMAEVPEEVALRVRTPDHEVEDLQAKLVYLFQSPDARADLARAGRRHIQEQHAIDAVAQRYAAMIEQAAWDRRVRDGLWVEHGVDALARAPDRERTLEVSAAWADLRVRGQRALHARVEDVGTWQRAGVRKSA